MVEPQSLLCREAWMTILSTLFTCYPQQRNISISDSHAPTFAYSSLCGGQRALYLNSAVQEREVSRGALLGGSRVSPDRVRYQVRGHGSFDAFHELSGQGTPPVHVCLWVSRGDRLSGRPCPGPEQYDHLQDARLCHRLFTGSAAWYLAGTEAGYRQPDLLIIPNENPYRLAYHLRDRGFGITTISGSGMDSNRMIILTTTMRKNIALLNASLAELAPDAFVSVLDTRTTMGGHVTRIPRG